MRITGAVWTAASTSVLLAITLLARTSVAAGDTRAEQVDVFLKHRRFVAELADSKASRARGLMFRRGLAADGAMLFVYEPPQRARFWMKNMRFSLDIVFADETGTITDVYRGVPPCGDSVCPPYPSSSPVKYVLELNAGTTSRLQVHRGDGLRVQALEQRR